MHGFGVRFPGVRLRSIIHREKWFHPLSMSQCKKDVTQVCLQWSYVFLALIHQYLLLNPKISTLLMDCWIWVMSRNWGCLVTWFCYQLIAKPGNKTATVSWPDPYEQINCYYDRYIILDTFFHLNVLVFHKLVMLWNGVGLICTHESKINHLVMTSA